VAWSGFTLLGARCVSTSTQKHSYARAHTHTQFQSIGIMFALLFFSKRLQAAPRYFQVLQEWHGSNETLLWVVLVINFTLYTVFVDLLIAMQAFSAPPRGHTWVQHLKTDSIALALFDYLLLNLLAQWNTLRWMFPTLRDALKKRIFSLNMEIALLCFISSQCCFMRPYRIEEFLGDLLST